MQIAHDLFLANTRRSRELVDLFRTLNSQTTGALDLSDLLRAALVMSVSSLDYFVHEVVRIGMLESFRGKRVRTPAFLRFQVSLESVVESASGSELETWLETQIRERHGYQSFQLPERVADAIRLVSDVELWNGLAQHLGMQRRDLTDTLTLIVQRRNKIAHEADIMPDYAGQLVYSDLRSPIDEETVDHAVDFIERVVEGIYALVSLNKLPD